MKTTITETPRKGFFLLTDAETGKVIAGGSRAYCESVKPLDPEINCRAWLRDLARRWEEQKVNRV